MSSTIEIIATLIALALGIGSLFSAIGQLISERRQRGAIRQQLTLGRSRGAEVEGISVESPEQRINRLIASLSEAANAAEEIGEEIKSRQEVAKKLQEDIQRYEQLREVNQEEVQAVAQVLGGELRKEGRRSFWAGFFLNLIFFVLGIGTTIGLSLLFGL